MCLAIPGRVTVIQDSGGGTRTAVVDYPGLTKVVSLLYLPDVQVGQWVLVQAGFAIRALSEDQAREVLEDLASDPEHAVSSNPVGGSV